MFETQLLDSTHPTSRRAYFVTPVVSAAAIGVGATLLSLGSSINIAQAAYMGVGAGITAFGTGILIAVYAVGQERANYWRMRAEMEAHKPIPVDPNIDHDPKYYPELPAVQEANGHVGYVDQVNGKWIELKNLRKAKHANQHYAQSAEVIGRVVVRDADTGSGADLVNATAGMWRMARFGGDDPRKSMSDATWTGKGKPFAKSEWHALRDYLIKNGLAYWNNENAPDQGWKLRPRARALIRSLGAKHKTAPPPGTLPPA